MNHSNRWPRDILLSALLLFFAQAALASPPWVPEPNGKTYFAVIVENVDESVAWYQKAFGLEEVDRAEAEDKRWQIVNLKNGGLLVEIIRDNRATEVEKARGLFKVGFEVADVAAVADRVKEATGEELRVIPFPAHGVRLLQLKDPEGNVIQLFSALEP
ncbi:MAG: VOC family protein [Acidobacteriota bacterium]